jgi:RNA-directed DNA polymerase
LGWNCLQVIYQKAFAFTYLNSLNLELLKLGVPTALDRFIQQAVLQVLQEHWDRTFSEHSYGFRPGRSAHQAVTQAQAYIAEGYRYTVDIDLEKFLDRAS